MNTNPSADQTSTTPAFSSLHTDLTAALTTVALGINPKITNPAQHGVRVQSSSNAVTLCTFDLETAVSVTLPGATPTMAGASLLDHAQWTKVMGALVAGEAKAVAARMPVTLSGDLLTGGAMTVPIATPDPAAYIHPPLPAPTLATADSGELLGQLLRTLSSCGTDDTLPTLTGVDFTFHGQTLTLAATDRYRFAVADVPTTLADGVTADDRPMSAVVQGAVLKRLVPVLKAHAGTISLGISTDGRWFTLTAGQITVTTRTLDGRLPRYKKLFPAEAPVSVGIPRTTLAAALKKCAAVLKAKGDKHTPVSLLWDGEGRLTLAPVLPEAQDRARLQGIPVPHTADQGDPAVLPRRHVSFKPAYLADALAAFSGDTVTLHIPAKITTGDALAMTFTDGPAISGDGYRHLLMSVRLEDGTWNL
ncbi:hypothetical protein ACIGHB_29590 [Streptomyces sp. NPDC085460]|uniref:DNA polymerase III subunit beta family protein n=1 Tax=Streptomyces sp. NPDC085460 TaxID=3365723 RepID=UPI0037D02BDA